MPPLCLSSEDSRIIKIVSKSTELAQKFESVFIDISKKLGHDD